MIEPSLRARLGPDRQERALARHASAAHAFDAGYQRRGHPAGMPLILFDAPDGKQEKDEPPAPSPRLPPSCPGCARRSSPAARSRCASFAGSESAGRAFRPESCAGRCRGPPVGTCPAGSTGTRPGLHPSGPLRYDRPRRFPRNTLPVVGRPGPRPGERRSHGPALPYTGSGPERNPTRDGRRLGERSPPRACC